MKRQDAEAGPADEPMMPIDDQPDGAAVQDVSPDDDDAMDVLLEGLRRGRLENPSPKRGLPKSLLGRGSPSPSDVL